MQTTITVVRRPFQSVIRRAMAVLACALIVTPSSAQEPSAAVSRTVVPVADGVAMRSGSGAAWYPVATVRSGTVLKADAEFEGWLRVEYLPGMHVVVKADEGDLKEAESKVVLNRRSRLRALNTADPVFEESFKAVFEESLAPGTEMRYVGPIRNRAGEVAGYIVVPPSGAKGFVSAREVRDARPEETAAPQRPVEQPRPAPPQPAPAQTAPAAPESSATDDHAEPAGQQASEPVPAPVEPSVPAPVAAAPEPKAPAGPTIRQLDRAFDDLMSKPLADADPQELIEQYYRYSDNIEGTPGSDRTIKYIDTRVQLLKIRQRARDLLPEIQALEDASRSAADKYRLTIDRLVANRQYKVVGLLVPSTVYDGTRLPRMYRLVSVDPGVKSTLAYLIPVPEHQMEQKVGAVVGVLGDGRIEPAAMVEIITPTLVDVLRPASEMPPVEVP